MLYLGPLLTAADLLGPGPLNTDDRPVIEFLAPRLTRVGSAGDKDWFIGEPLADFTDSLAEHSARPEDGPFPPSAPAAAARRAGRDLYRYALAAARGDDERATGLEREVRDLVPEVVAADQGAGSAARLVDVRRSLGALRYEQDRLRRRLEAMEEQLHDLNDKGEGP